MDYNVRYNIDINGAAASRNLSSFQNNVQKSIPPIITNLEILRKEIGKINAAFISMNRFIGTKPKTVKFTIDKGMKKQLSALQTEINAIKGKTITINTKTNQVDTLPLGTSKTTGRTVRGSTNRNGSNRAARGFGNGANGLFGLSDVMYTAGFGFPNMIGAAMIGMGTMSIVKDMADYENIMATSNAILKRNDKDIGSYNDRYSQMSKNIRQVGVDTKFTTTEVAGAAKYLAMAGMGISDINNSIRPIADLAIIGDAPLDKMADIITNIQTAYGISSEKMPQIADILTSVTTGTNTTVLEMGESFKFAAPMMSMAGISFNEASAAIGLLGNAGLKATVAGTALRAMMVRLLAPTKKGLKVLKEYNISLYETDKRTGKIKLRSLHDIFSQLKEKDVSLPDMITIFDKIGGNAANNVFAELKKMPEIIEKSINSVGLANATAKMKQDTIYGRWEKMKSQFTESGMQIFEAYNPAIKQGLDEIINSLKSPGTIQAIKDVSSGILMITQTAIKLFKIISDNWKWLGALFLGRLITTRITGIISALFNLSKTFGTAGVAARIFGTILGTSSAGAVGAGGMIAGGGILGALGGIPGLIATAVAALGILAYNFYKNGQRIKNIIGEIEQEISTMIPGYGEKDEEDAISKDNKKTYFDLKGLSSFTSEESANNIIRKLGEKDAAKSATSAYGMMANLNPISKTISSDFDGIANSLSQEAVRQKPSIGIGKVAGHLNVTRGGGRATDYYKNPFDGKIHNYLNTSIIYDQVKPAKELFTDEINKTDVYLEEYNKTLLGLSQNLRSSFDPFFISQTKENALRIIKNFAHIDLFQEGDNDIITKQKIEKVYERLAPFGNLAQHIMHPLSEDIAKWSPNNITVDKGIRQEDPLDGKNGGGGIDGLGGAGSNLQGIGNGSSIQTKHIIVNIQSLIGNVKIDSTNGEDMETLRDKVTQVMMDAVKDFEISYS